MDPEFFPEGFPEGFTGCEAVGFACAFGTALTEGSAGLFALAFVGFFTDALTEVLAEVLADVLPIVLADEFTEALAVDFCFGIASDRKGKDEYRNSGDFWPVKTVRPEWNRAFSIQKNQKKYAILAIQYQSDSVEVATS